MQPIGIKLAVPKVSLCMHCYTLPVSFCDWLEEGTSTKAYTLGLEPKLHYIKLHFLLQKYRPPVVPHKNLIGYIRKLTGCHPLAQCLYQLVCKNEIVTRTQKVIHTKMVLYHFDFLIWVSLETLRECDLTASMSFFLLFIPLDRSC